MKQIANIISEKPLMNHDKLSWINYYVYDDSFKDKIHEKVDLFLPTIILSWSLFKKELAYLVKPHILNKKIPLTYPRVGWEFSMDEKMTDHFNGLENFVKTAPREYLNNFLYQSIDPIRDGIKNEEHLIELIKKSCSSKGKMSIYLYKDEIIYIFNKHFNQITGIYLTSFKYFGFDIKKIIDQVSELSETKFIDSDGTIYQSYYKQFPDFDYLKRIMILFLR